MALLKSIKDVPGIDFYEYRDSLFYNKYEYRVRFDLPCVRYTWYCKKPEDLDKKIVGKFSSYANVKKEDMEAVLDNLPALKSVVSLQKNKRDNSYSMRIEGSTVSVFSSDLNELKKIETTLGAKYKYIYTQVQTSNYAGVKQFVNEPKHKYRVYLKSKRVSDTFHVELREMFKRQPKLFPSAALKRWMSNDGKKYGIWYFRWTSAAHFIDYDDESTLSYLALMHGEALGKKYKLEKRPDNI